jgi:crossover junction endodeoxyribonuclease RuvC
MGYALLQADNNKLSLVHMDVLKMGYKRDMYERLEVIHHTINSVIRQYKPTSFAIEAPFFGKNVQSMLKLGRAQGVAIAAAMTHGLSVTEYSPRKIKQSVTGNGNADKEQVWKMLEMTLQLKERPDMMDASDALAVAVCHHYQSNSILALNDTSEKKAKTEKVKGGWESFINQNPGRVK